MIVGIASSRHMPVLSCCGVQCRMPVTPDQAMQLAIELKPDAGHEQAMLLLWVEEHPEGWLPLEEALSQSHDGVQVEPSR